ncbi:uncharacterized protein EV420DRAFT_1638896 [Desarmillaria tabescens]|uniref:Uncharacterized protein n=1 Tax=Armillaria tabescens TaxID=1929756 RepID=A0AA39T4G5_ARMTA|nr:uncharacterized protein EV420DRAFT_1638896 [Desarmillaria tabescens]KAK0463976.1 hypothetical protein EV420DRAFT_1638896 [Desarmillaria tabescens]
MLSASERATFPPEIIDLIVSGLWNSTMPSKDRVHLMTTCPLINSVWQDVYATHSSRDVYIPTVKYLQSYLCGIIQSQQSVIYGNRLPASVRTMTCYVDLTRPDEEAAKDTYVLLTNLPNFIGLRACFTSLRQLFLNLQFRASPWKTAGISGIIKTSLCIFLDPDRNVTVHRADFHVKSPGHAHGLDELVMENIIRAMGSGSKTMLDPELMVKSQKLVEGAPALTRYYRASASWPERRGDLHYYLNYSLWRAVTIPNSLHRSLLEPVSHLVWRLILQQSLPINSYFQWELRFDFVPWGLITDKNIK